MYRERMAVILEYAALPTYIAIKFLLDNEDTVRVQSEAIWEFIYANRIAKGIVQYDNTYAGKTVLEILELARERKQEFPVLQSTMNPQLIFIDKGEK